MRCFVGIELTAGFLELASLARRAIIARDPDWAAEKWVRPENLHVTLAFLGEVDQVQLRALVDGLGAITSPTVELAEARLVAIPRLSRASMAWLEFTDARGTGAALAELVHIAASGAGIPVAAAPHAFRAHLTLVRSRRERTFPRTAIQDVAHIVEHGEWPSMSVSSATVFTSTLAPTGPVYDRVATVAFAKS